MSHQSDRHLFPREGTVSVDSVNVRSHVSLRQLELALFDPVPMGKSRSLLFTPTNNPSLPSIELHVDGVIRTSQGSLLEWRIMGSFTGSNGGLMWVVGTYSTHTNEGQFSLYLSRPY